MVCLSSAAFMWRCAWWRLRQQGKQSNARTAFTPCAVPCIGRCTRRSTSLRLSSWQPRLDVAEEKTGTRGSSYNKKRLLYEREQRENLHSVGRDSVRGDCDLGRRGPF